MESIEVEEEGKEAMKSGSISCAVSPEKNVENNDDASHGDSCNHMKIWTLLISDEFS